MRFELDGSQFLTAVTSEDKQQARNKQTKTHAGTFVGARNNLVWAHTLHTPAHIWLVFESPIQVRWWPLPSACVVSVRLVWGVPTSHTGLQIFPRFSDPQNLMYLMATYSTHCNSPDLISDRCLTIFAHTNPCSTTSMCVNGVPRMALRCPECDRQECCLPNHHPQLTMHLLNLNAICC